MKNDFIVYGRPVQIFQRIVNEYAKYTGNTLASGDIERLLMKYDIKARIEDISDDTLKNMIEREICRETYFPKLPIKLYNNTRTVYIDRHVAEECAICKGLDPYLTEGYIRIYGGKTQDEIDKMSDEELGQLLEDIIRDDLLLTAEVAIAFENGKII